VPKNINAASDSALIKDNDFVEHLYRIRNAMLATISNASDHSATFPGKIAPVVFHSAVVTA
jgi:hypothetical protein